MEGTASGRLAKEVYDLASETDILSRVRRMSLRCASRPVDKISGLFFVLLGPRAQRLNGNEVRLPKYNESALPEEAWDRLVHALADGDLEKLLPESITYLLLKNFPHPSQEHWFPNWRQVISWPTVSIREVQRADQQQPKVDRSLRLRSGRVLFNCRLYQRQWSKLPNSKLMHGLSYSISTIHPGIGDYFRFLSCWLEPFVQSDSEVPAIDTEKDYALILVGKGAAMTPKSACTAESLAIVCRDISRFRLHQGTNPRIYVKRVTTLQVVRTGAHEESGPTIEEGESEESLVWRGEDIADFDDGKALYLE